MSHCFLICISSQRVILVYLAYPETHCVLFTDCMLLMLMVCNVSSCDWYMVRLAGVQELIELLTCTSSLFLLLQLFATKTVSKVTISRRTMLCSPYSYPATLEGGKLFSSCSIVTWLDKACCDDINDLLKDSIRRQFVDVFLACCEKPGNSAAARKQVPTFA